MSLMSILVSFAITIVAIVVVYEKRVSSYKRKYAKELEDNVELLKAIRALHDIGDDLVIGYKTLLEIAKERFTQDEINKMFNEKIVDVAVKHRAEKRNQDGE